MRKMPVTCEVRYRIDPDRMSEFEAYAHIWTELIERHGGMHHGYFLPGKRPDEASVSFAGQGSDGARDIAIALFTFADEAAYAQYREQVAKDPDGIAANARFRDDPPFVSYERMFLTPLPRRG
ncbi:NIPSNAP family protein [Rhizobium sp. AG855]|uniref:NIPSNAP family protein n=1 Tax=Rhizobium sp. AG855 TaxID=2183898 RepID=UPI000FEE9153|nr:NIPSNAP family protein [Rhizobium sp. AG855]RKE85708.1 NIPSNAP protein [Rhizobium sp. AG855]